MRKIFVNCALEYLRKSDVLREATDLDNTAELIQPDSSAISDMSAAELMNLVKELPVGFRTVFNMLAIEGYSHKEISEMLNITEYFPFPIYPCQADYYNVELTHCIEIR